MASGKGPRKGSSGSSGAKAVARQRQAEQRAVEAMLAAQAERRRRLFRVLVPVAVVVAVIVALVITTLLNRTDLKSGVVPTAAEPAVVAAVTGVPLATLDTVGTGTVSAFPKQLRSALLTGTNGKPRVLYVGAEFCPYCAAERWSVAVALARFGTFTGLGQTASGPSDSYPNTATLTFHGATFSSSELDFNGYEIQSNQVKSNAYTKLDTLDAADAKLFSSVGGNSFPFLDIGGRYAISGASYSPSVLKGKTAAQISAALADPNSPIAKAVDGTANVITAAICASTADAPAAVCTSAGVTTAKAKL